MDPQIEQLPSICVVEYFKKRSDEMISLNRGDLKTQLLTVITLLFRLAGTTVLQSVQFLVMSGN